MSCIIKPASELREEEIKALYAIYKFAFQGKGVPERTFQHWRADLDHSYCYTGEDRIIQIFGSSEKPDGYTMFTTPVNSDGRQISKIIQGGIGETKKGDRKKLFETMIKQLAESKKDISFLVEIGVEFDGIVDLFINCGFYRPNSIPLVKRLVHKLITNRRYGLIEGNHSLLIQRDTLLQEGYVGILATNYPQIGDSLPP